MKIEVLRFFFTFFCQIADQPFKKGAFFSKRHLITPWIAQVPEGFEGSHKMKASLRFFSQLLSYYLSCQLSAPLKSQGSNVTPLHWRIASRLHKSIDSSFQPKNHGHGAINLLAIKIKYIKFMNKFCQPRRQSPVKKSINYIFI